MNEQCRQLFLPIFPLRLSFCSKYFDPQMLAASDYARKPMQVNAEQEEDNAAKQLGLDASALTQAFARCRQELLV
jgi:hypothetical protein